MEPNEEKKQEETKKMREIIIHTDGYQIQIIKAEISGNLEFRAILETLLRNLQ